MRKKNKKKELSFIKKNLILIFCCLTLVCFMSIGYSALNQSLYITGEVALRAVKDIRISDLRLTNISNGGYENYNSNFTVNSISLSAHLPNLGSSVTYEATIKNKGTVPMEVSELTGSTSVSGVSYKIDGLEVGTVTEAGSTTTFTITLTRTTAVTTTDDSVSSLIELAWKEYEPPYPGNEPDLLNNSLTPIVYDEDYYGTGSGSWVVADTTQEWYNYSNQEWANAVILEEGITKKVGDPVLVPTAELTETEVRAMYVWIPRYEYKIEGKYGTHTDGTAGTSALPGEIEVNFIPATQTSASSGYILHPAFQWDNDDNGSMSASENIAGIWVGKFETSASTSSTCYTSPSRSNCNNTNQEPRILPNVSALAYQQVSRQFPTAQKFMAYLTNSTDTDSHMMKNSEWGAVAYLSQSSYGKYGNSSYTGTNKEIYLNDSSGLYTGRSSGQASGSASAEGTCYYDDITDRGNGLGSCGAGASTTGNIYGVYDMSGGSQEYVMGYLTTANSNYESNPDSYFGWTATGNSAGFTYKPVDKYFDDYTETTGTTACNGGICYGHALSEISLWYGDVIGIVSESNPWFTRGNHNSTNRPGIFNSGYASGNADYRTSFRSVILSTSPTGEGGGTTPDTPEPSEPYTDPILVGNDPNLLNNSLVPIMYDETANSGVGAWIVASEYDEWYNYSNQQWANAVILEDGVTKNVGDTITVPTASSTTTEVKAMYVWIPRYEYKIEGTYGTHTDGTAGTAELPGEIEVSFIPTTQTSASSGYILHPAFQWDNDDNGSISASENISGIWVGKFETSADASSTCYAISSTTNCTSDKVTPYILPNVKSLRYQNISNQFATAQKFGTYLSNSENIDSHMMKNSEWGAVAYLSQSSYGKYGNSSYTGANKEIYKNDSSGIYTGRSSGVPPASGDSTSGTCNYDNITDRGDGSGSCGAGASTTGNIYGVYDMSGGSNEYVMGYLTTSNSNYESNPDSYFGWTDTGNIAGFTSKPADKYFDDYTTTTNTTACSGGICYGHALSETRGWYSDATTFVNAGNPWFWRGGANYATTSAGVFYVHRHTGAALLYYTFRSVLLAE